MIDSERPHPQRHNRKNPDRKKPRERHLTDIEVRFVYQNELRGTWFRLAEAVTRSLPILPNPEYRVTRIEVRDISEI